MPTIVPNRATPTWFNMQKKYCYFIQGIGPLATLACSLIVIATGTAEAYWSLILFFYFGIALIDLMLGKDTLNPDIEEQLKADKFYDRYLIALVPLYLLSFVAAAYTVSTVPMPWHSHLAAVLTMGAMFSGVFCVGHELGHRTGRQARFWARVSISIFGYGHFHIEHNRGHHQHVSTPEDAASARMGENLYQFMLREIPNTIARAFELESTRLKRSGFSFWSKENEVLQAYAITLLIHGSLLLWLGMSVLPFLLLSIFFGYFQLSMANYLEHYGLLRKKRPNGLYERCLPEHSWNSNYFFSNMITLQLQRHSDHHANAMRPYQILRDYEDVPNLPAGYPFMQFLTIFPPLWRAVMDRQLLKFVNYDLNRVNISPSKREKLFAKYHRHAAGTQ